ncbi:vWA domain-containing protein [Actinokineospora auranticolor]|uniref:von Willebrand factor type A domain-containing protein n=1 Tax=Actinokineospora auranticolor TaxID=155976 RepID=A0A2S6GME6_9PSEU|nr:vWA domain-containing protein [Actinokineospora auranticolor]PPK66387.1 von Willebrand factor type A domain-containing protein [Actinokineospora auranticolor]
MGHGFEITVDQNEYLPAGGRVMDAIITVRLTGDDPGSTGRDRGVARVVLLDCSGSMSGSRLTQAKRAVTAFVDALPDGAAFAVVRGTDVAGMVYPVAPELAIAGDRTRGEAKDAVRRLGAGGGTAIGSWLALAKRLLADHSAAVRHALLLTDGRDEHETPERLAEVVRDCEGAFTCDALGVGEGTWQADTLERVADGLLGAARGLPDPAALAAEFREVTERLMGTAAVDADLLLWTPAHAEVRFFKQVFPRFVDLTGRGTQVTPRVRAHPTGNWSAEAREYHLSVRVEAGRVGDKGLIAARVHMAVGDERSAERTVHVKWTDDQQLATSINENVAHYAGQSRVPELLDECLSAVAAGDRGLATDRLDRAIAVADAHGNAKAAAHLRNLLDTDPAGTVRVRDGDMTGYLAEMAKIESKLTTRLRDDR